MLNGDQAPHTLFIHMEYKGIIIGMGVLYIWGSLYMGYFIYGVLYIWGSLYMGYFIYGLLYIKVFSI